MSGRGKQDGFIIVAVLWMIAALALLAAIYTRFALTTAVAASVHEDRLRADGLISAAVELAAYQLTAAGSATKPSSDLAIAGSSTTAARPTQPSPAQMPTRGAFSFRLGRSGITVEYESEASRIDLNFASKEVLSGLFRTIGAEPDQANYYGDRIVGWRKKGEATGENEEASAYRVAGIPYKPRQGPFQSAAELWLVLGIPPALTERVLPLVTVYSGQPEVDAEIAAPEIVASLPNMTPERLGTVLQNRAAPMQLGQSQANQPGANQTLAPSPPAQSFRLHIRMALENGRRVTAEAVILVLQDGDEPYRVLSWRDDFDGVSS